ncbi:hypothetical protein QYM36_007576 [Artemia franciscana]|uniref:Uncharacterized protein n=1 Tax=Artemia franciscana TaxID=6661 RepID=A0AA88LK74_ARTSF|nr:hypothetical protein QYM36_007576 [Artemia franciscana]
MQKANEVLSVPDLLFLHLSSKLTRIEKVLNAVASRAEVYDNHFPPLPQPIEPNVLATIAVSKIPASLGNPIKRKEMLDKVTGHECVDRSYLRQYPLEEVQETGLQSITLGLQFKVRQKHFKHGGLKIKCLATLAALYWRSDERSAEPAAMTSSYNLHEHKAYAEVSPTSEDSRYWFFNIGKMLSKSLALPPGFFLQTLVSPQKLPVYEF